MALHLQQGHLKAPLVVGENGINLGKRNLAERDISVQVPVPDLQAPVPKRAKGTSTEITNESLEDRPATPPTPQAPNKNGYRGVRQRPWVRCLAFSPFSCKLHPPNEGKRSDADTICKVQPQAHTKTLSHNHAHDKQKNTIGQVGGGDSRPTKEDTCLAWNV